jgi:hypothetical protein
MNDITIHHNRTFTHRDGASYNVLLQAETNTGRTWCTTLFGQMADPIIDRVGLDIAIDSLTRQGIKHAWTIGADLQAEIQKHWGETEYADPAQITECNDRLRIKWDDGSAHGHSETWMLHGSSQVDPTGSSSTQRARYHAAKGQWKICPYSVNFWGSHPDAGNDDCYSGEDYVELYEAMNAFTAEVDDTSVRFIELTNVPWVDDVLAVRPNPDHVPSDPDDNDDWKREIAQQAGMGLGIDAYNDAMGAPMDRREYLDNKEDGREDDTGSDDE